jgi:uncharacterized protein (TIGR03437 family)
VSSRARRLAVAAALFVLSGLSLIGARTEPSRLRRLSETPRGRASLNPGLSGDGRRVAFESNADLAGAGGPDSFRLFAARLSEGVQPSELSRSRGPAPALSQDGSRVAFASASDPLGSNRDGNSEIFLHDGVGLTQLTDTTPDDPARRAAEGSFAPSVSDDGRLVAFASDRDLAGLNPERAHEVFLYDAEARRFTRLTDGDSGARASDAKISGDGSRVYFVRERVDENETVRELWRYTRETGARSLLVGDARRLALGPGRAVSDDGLRVVFAAETAPNTTQVFLLDGRNHNRLRQLTRLGARAADVPLHPTISGDGHRVAFATRRNFNNLDRDASVELYVYDIPTDTFARVTDTRPAGTSEAVASLDDEGARVAFSFPRVLADADAPEEFADDPELFVADLDPRPAFATGLRFFNAAALDKSTQPADSVAADSVVVVHGANLAPIASKASRLSDGSFPARLQNVTLTVAGRHAQLFYVSPTQINFHLPADAPHGPAEVSITNHDGFETRGVVHVARVAPGIFASGGNGAGEALALDAATGRPPPSTPPTDAATRARSSSTPPACATPRASRSAPADATSESSPSILHPTCPASTSSDSPSPRVCAGPAPSRCSSKPTTRRATARRSRSPTAARRPAPRDSNSRPPLQPSRPAARYL